MFRPSKISLAVALALGGISSPVVFAAETQDASVTLNMLEVTTTRGATKTETPFVETPQSISLVSEEQIEEQGARNVQEATRYTAGVFTGQYGSTAGRYDAIKLRGFGSDSIDNQYLDGLKLLNDKGTYSIMQIDPYFLEGIEVVKGPSSVLYGRAAPGGIVALTSKKPLFEQHRQIQAGIGNNGTASLGFDMGDTIGESGSAAYRVVGRVYQSDTQWDKVEEEHYSLAPSLTLDLSDATTLTLMAYLQKDPEGGFYGGLPAEGTLFDHNGRRISNEFFDGEENFEEFDREQTMVGYQLEHRFNDVWSARQNVRYVNTQVDYGQVYNLGYWVGDTLPRTYFGADEELDAFAIDNQLLAEFEAGATRHTLLTGLDYQHRTTDAYWTSDYDAAYNTDFAPIDAFDPVYGASGRINPYQDNERRLEQTGVYLQDQIALDRWRLTLGGRYDWVEVRNEYDNMLTGVQGDEELEDEHFSGRAALMYLFDNGVAPYISYSESFSPSANVDENGDLIKATEASQYEFGLKYQPNGSGDRYSVALFQIDQDNVANMNRTTYAYEAVGSVRSRGVELEALSRLTDNLTLQASYTYTDVEVQKSTTGTEGKTPVATPEHMASAWGAYEFHDGSLNSLKLGLGVRYIGESWVNESNTLEAPSYTLTDALVKYDLSNVGLDGVSAQLNVNNLFDKEYVGACYSESICYFGAGRSVMATLSYDL
ncbi:TonB-dependent siderophore receptor [Marinobacterium mangrovicola]|uniref:Iron complex outermembrane receptor protein n=1 Tax=Marinobacterium mangrovicola TaxID=1476959 RepID=A0A4R1GR35_9GAMM|nr:TonB-dependent siderophore receptor [Marinobacterium mangrovicola]TCK06962.1 iron complex outermembrane receptor protein [Marinobacterium mangrovicola]